MRRSALVVLPVVLGIVGALPATAWAAKRPAADTTAPTVSVTTPTSGATVGSPFSASGSAADNTSLSKVTVSLDGGAATTATGTSSWSWSSPTVAAGSHTIKVTAYDSSSNTASTTVSVSVPVATDTTAPTIAITTPSASTTVAGTFQVAGSAADDTGVSSVQVKVDNGPLQLANGTTSWSLGLDAGSWAGGNHTITAIAADAAGNVQSASVVVSVAAAQTTTTSGPDIALVDPAASSPLVLLGRRASASYGSLNAVLYVESGTTHYGLFVRDTTTGTSAYVRLPVDDTTGWSNAALAMTSPTDLWTSGGNGPMVARHFTLTGSTNGVPTAATQVSRQGFGDTDSRQGDIVALASGAVVYSWHQQGATGSQGGWVSYLRAGSSTWQAPQALDLGVTKASKEVLAQQPVDASVWLFSEADATGALAVARLTESGGSLAISWTNPTYLTTTSYGDNAPDPENPDLEAVADPSTGTIALAYQSAVRKMFATSPTVVTGSYPVVARFPASGAPTFVQLPVYVERITVLGLAVRPGETWLTFRPVDPATLTFDHLQGSVYRNGAWSSPTALGQAYSGYEALTGASDQPQVTVRLTDGRLHQLLLG